VKAIYKYVGPSTDAPRQLCQHASSLQAISPCPFRLQRAKSVKMKYRRCSSRSDLKPETVARRRDGPRAHQRNKRCDQFITMPGNVSRDPGQGELLSCSLYRRDMVSHGGGRLLARHKYTEFRGKYCRLLQGEVSQANAKEEAGGKQNNPVCLTLRS
jgi:hypothetical protein